ncbi:nucleoside transporter family protein, putative [Ichthyophthirius multifiliis]|uniref:Nucleoside transporter family protein, putative n=1 Tax=Ichthyophthirius multifiliis TaxID=5932 RepID=G0QUG4_ICHMU|nr:nucleoside transporter family protein, putative [Ichthyophthirius multifiliis]EGR31160.1 nucleoside transporter family protein, putative [Ichthyophthirius multifiliis]|eukprot:XP_004034646.1 nucleoside transporter family protein, putative [Ichthyophthirius multifiliis]
MKSKQKLITEDHKQIDSPLTESQESTKLIHKITFMFLGASSLIGWNAVLTALDFFSNRYPKSKGYGDVSFLFPIPLFIANFFFGLLVPKLADIYSLTIRISGCLIGVAIFMIFLPILALLLPNNIGYYLCFLCTFFLGMFNSIAQNSSIALASSTNQQLLGVFWTFTGVSGFSMNVSRAFVFLIFGANSYNSSTYGTIIYFILAVVITIITIFLQINFIKSEYYQEIQIRDQNNLLNKNTDGSAVSDNNISIQNEEKPGILGYIAILMQGFQKAGLAPVFIWFIYIQTFMLFPGVSVFQKKFHQLPDGWQALILITIYNFGDVTGKYVGSFKIFGLIFMYLTVMGRFVFYLTFLLTVHQLGNAFLQHDAFACVNMYLFSFSNGFATSGLMRLAPEKAKVSKDRDLIAFICAFGLTFGIMTGQLLALTLDQQN